MHFEKISYEQWVKDMPLEGVDTGTIIRWYKEIELPKQGSEHSMGVDFFMPYTVKVLPHNKVKIPTGVRWVIPEKNYANYGLLLVPRSSVGIKDGMRLLNTIGVVDADYYLSDNEGHIMLFMENTTDEIVVLPKGKGIVQGLIVPFAIPIGTESDDKRNGGFGSTDNKN